ncbi:MAG: phosphoglycerate dehydrogenase [Eubacterium sp.]|nr:phosphoglycerate dehydrogenase [Eubacterium sp.]
MFRYHTLNNISPKGIEKFSDNYQPTDNVAEADAILVRSAKMQDMDFSDNLLAIARAGAGVNNIPVDECAEKGIVVFNTPGQNANGVKELVIAGMLLASRDIVGGIEWVKQDSDDPEIGKKAEKEKKQFAGCEISGKKLGIIGLGAIGQMVANAAAHLGMDVYGYDPFISVDAAWNLSRTIHHSRYIDEIFKVCDYITIHVPANGETKGMIGREQIDMMKEGVVLLNFARDILVDEPALVEALEAGKVKKYVTDFANPTIAGAPNTLVTPHLGASTEEAEDNCAVAAVRAVRDFLENGNIRHSVNYPKIDMGVCTDAGRITICHKNKVDMIRKFTSILTASGANVANMINKSKGEYAYTVFDLETPVTEKIRKEIEEVDGVFRVRIIV